MLVVCDSWVRGSLACVQYWKNAWNTPTVRRPDTSMPPASTPRRTWPSLPTKRTAGPTALVRKSAVELASASSAAEVAIESVVEASKPNDLTIRRPE